MTGSEPAPEPPGRVVYRPPLAALLGFLAAALTAAGMFLPLFISTTRLGYPNVVLIVTITGWDVTATANGLPDAPPVTGATVPANGVPLIFAMAVLLLAAVLVKLAVARPTVARTSGVVTTAGAAFLVGIVWTVGMQELDWMERIQPRGQTATAPDLSVEVSAGVGFWLLVGAAVVAVAAAVVVMRPVRTGSGDGERTEPETPRFGIPVVVHRLPDAPPDKPSGE